MLNMKNVLIFGLILSFFIVGCGQDQGQPTSESVSEQTGSMLDEGKKMIQQAEQEALQLKETVVKQAGEIADKAGAIKDNTAAIVADLIANANTSLNMGRFNDAISSAKEVLTNYDGNSQKAKDIITTATEKMKTMIAEKAKAAIDAAAALKAEETIDTAAAAKEAEALGSTATEKVESVKSGLTDKLKSFGQ
ncbi:MAG: hypothetical protein HOF76_15085 [Candidatus Scalindua sp.]|jgi:hypothetical protein|nr:hypothetical protein [Candidatus Scalindua sp.]MBT7211717.1 hypothetical protein [Candidatus Scalindua sp.]